MTFAIKRKGLMLVLSSPSGAGKTSICKKILEVDDEITMSISVTTRPPRKGEVEGRDYFFTDPKSFEDKIISNQFLEYALVFGNRYGTLKNQVFNILEEGKDVLFDIDWQGAKQIKNQAHSDLVSIFILPPSLISLKQRLHHRNQDDPEVVEKRMEQATQEISHWCEYDYVIINHSLEESVEKVYTILKGERLKRSRQLQLSDFVKNL
jgi:guanylate kinase